MMSTGVSLGGRETRWHRASPRPLGRRDRDSVKVSLMRGPVAKVILRRSPVWGGSSQALESPVIRHWLEGLQEDYDLVPAVAGIAAGVPQPKFLLVTGRQGLSWRRSKKPTSMAALGPGYVLQLRSFLLWATGP